VRTTGIYTELLERIQVQSTPSKGSAKKNFFNYLLLDPRITRNLKKQLDNNPDMPSKTVLETFVKSIFYVGKGKLFLDRWLL
jgi:hypothetical protein